jgi:predicted TIM-barrel fold metal-dependent hydrolase
MKNTIPVFDLHCHVTESLAIIPERHFQTPSIDNARNIISFLDTGTVKKLAIPAITLYNVADLGCNALALYAKLLAPERVYALAGLRRSLDRKGNAEMVSQSQRLLAMGFDGIKLICKPNVRRRFKFAINDNIFDDFFAEAEKQQWPILFHVADQIAFWHKALVPNWAIDNEWYYGDDQDLPSQQDFYDEIFAVLKRYPKLNITFAHFFFMWDRIDEVSALLDTYPHINLDLTPGTKMYKAFSERSKEARDLFESYGGRFIFGTDNTGFHGLQWDQNFKKGLEKIANQRRFLETEDIFDGLGFTNLHGINLDEKTLEKIYNLNFTRFLGEKPASVNREAAAELCREYRAVIKGDELFAENSLSLLDKLEKIFISK